MSFVAGSYLIGFNSKVCGQTAEGLRFERNMFKRLITGDWMGEAPQDAIHRGQECTSMVEFIEWDAAAMFDIMNPLNGSGVTDIVNGYPGVLDVGHGICKSLVLTSLLTATIINANGGTGASSINPLTRTLARTTRAEGYPIQELFASDLRTLPVKFRHYPTQRTQSSGTGGGVYGVDT